MADKVGIFNLALQRLWTRRVESPTEESREAEALLAIYDATRDFVLDEYLWSFAQAAVELSRLVDAPLISWRYFYQLPNDRIRIARVIDRVDGLRFGEGPSVPHEVVEDERIATDAEQVYLQYIRVVTDENLLPPYFVSLLAWRLAHEVGGVLAASQTRIEKAAAEYAKELNSAKGKDSRRGVVMPVTYTSWADARRAGVVLG